MLYINRSSMLHSRTNIFIEIIEIRNDYTWKLLRRDSTYMDLTNERFFLTRLNARIYTEEGALWSN